MATNNEESKFNFMGIFPECRNEYNKCRRKMHGKELTSYSMICSDFRNNIQKHYWLSVDIENICIQLLFYLHDIIKKKQNDNIEAHCNYFYYKLKYIAQKYGGYCGTAKNCYDVMRRKKDPKRVDISDVCLKHIVEIDNDVLKIMGYLEEIYELNDLFIQPIQRNASKVKKIEDYMDYLENYPDKYNGSLDQELDNVLKIYKSYLTSWSNCRYGKPVLQYFKKKWKDRNTFRITETIASTEISTREEASSSTEIITSAITAISASAGTSSGIIFFGFALIAIMFVLYKYTTYGSFLQPRVRMLKRRIRKENKHHKNLMDSFDRTYNNINYNDYRIAYTSED
ncbi:variable surface protein [Plasmodium gonderi]|uniref:Variable surface protein n=1 Tax=Plasmodium gonderi TaxID=77519 RepID=A0A1Y1JRN4_PLAGO|nr:variable surface protein [Plasmodium gonderi]GAW84118.1 variable surface protein [Plasmodium gonderi]